MKPNKLNALSPRFILIFGSLLICLMIFCNCFFHYFKQESLQSAPDQPGISTCGPRIRFEKNDGQTDPQVAFLCRGRNHILYLTSNGSVMHLNGDDDHLNNLPLQMEIVGANPDAKAKGISKLVSKSNYFRGNDPGRWITDVPNYDRVGFEDVYKNVDLIYYINDNEVEFDFVVKSGATPERIRMNFSGVKKMKISRNGDLIVNAGGHRLVYRKPIAWQTINGNKNPVDVRFALADKHELYFKIGEYNRLETLIIDPQVVYSSYLGGSNNESGSAIAIDAEGCAYLTGSTTSADFPTFNSFQGNLTPGIFNNLSDVFVTKFNASGTDIEFSTYLGGNWDDKANGIAIDENNHIYITGTTWSIDDPDTKETNEGFPLLNAYQAERADPSYKGTSDAFVTVLNNTGSSLYYSTYFGGDGEDTAEDIAISIDGNAFITGVNFSYHLPVKNAYMSSKSSYYYDAYVAKFNPHNTGENSLVYATYLGGNFDDYGYGIAVDKFGCAYVTGSAKSTDFPTTSDPIQGARKTSSDIFVTKFSTDGLSLEYSTYLGSDGSDEGKSIEVDTAGCAYICGYGSNGFPTTPGAFITAGGYSILSKLLPDGSGFVYSTHVPNSGRIAVDDKGQVYIASSYAKMVGEVIKSDAYIVAMNSEGSDTLFTLIFGGTESDGARDIAVDNDRSLYITGNTSSSDFPVTNAFQASYAGKNDVFVAKIGVPKEELIVKVFQDPLNHNPGPIANAKFEIYHIDLSKPENPFTFVETQFSDDNGLLYLPKTHYTPGEPFFIRTNPENVVSVKANHDDADNIMYKVFVDNLAFDNDGNSSAAVLKSKTEDTTLTYLAHTSLAYNLVVSIEWDATDDYVERLKSALRLGNTFFYDIANGQAYIQTIAIYDNKSHWKDADIQIFASNMQWPESDIKGIRNDNEYIKMPPVHFGSKNKNVNYIFKEPLDPETYNSYSTFVHEMGHYAFGFYDEYEDKDKKLVYPDENYTQPDINFGFMDDQYKYDQPISSEMSAFVTTEYMNTHQYQINDHKTCWEFFRMMFRNIYGDVIAEIHTPQRLGLESGQIVKGPAPKDMDVGSMMDFVDKTGPSASGRWEFLVKNEDTGEPIPGAVISIEKQNGLRDIDQGKTVISGADKGKIRLLGAESGDKVNCSRTVEPLDYQFLETLISSPTKSSLGLSEQDPQVLYLRSMKGTFTLLSETFFDESDNLIYRTISNTDFTSVPVIQSITDSGESDSHTLSGNSEAYTINLPESMNSGGELIFRAPDSSETTFFVSQNLTMFKPDINGATLRADHGNLVIYLDSSSLGLSQIAVLNYSFPVPVDELPVSVLRASPVYAINTRPSSGEIKGRMKIFYFADSLEAAVPAAVKIYHWKNGWLPLSTSVDLELNSVSSAIDESGFYAAFLDLSQSHVITSNDDEFKLQLQTGFRLFPNYPNPFSSFTTIGFELTANTRMNVSIYDIQGRKVQTLIDKTMAAGEHFTTWDGTDETGQKLPAGVYFCIVRTLTSQVYRKMILIR